MIKTGILLLAAGAGKRFGGNKLSAMVDNQPMFMRAMDVIDAQKKAACRLVVTGHPSILHEAKKRGWDMAVNEQPELGISWSIRLGMEKMLKASPDLDGILFMVCDQPWLTKETVGRMLTQYEKGILALKYNGCPGNPVLFSKDYFNELMALEGDVGGRQVMDRHKDEVYYLEILNAKELRDIDRREELNIQEDSKMGRIYFDQAEILKPKADGVEEVMAQAANMPVEQVQELIEDTRVQLNSLFHGPGADAVVFTAGVRAAQEQVLRAVLKKGDHILVSPVENDTVMNTLDSLAGDVEYTILPCDDKGQLILFDETKGEKPFETIERLVKDNTKAIILNHASEVCGTVLEVKAVAEYARKKGLLVIVNAAYTAAFVPIFMNIWGIDVLTFSGGYGLLASESIGGFIASEKARELLGGEDMRGNFEQNPLDTAAVLGLHKAFDFIKETRLYTLSSVGQKRAEQFIRKVQHVNGLHIIGPGYNNRVPIVSIQTDFMDEADLVKDLEEKYGIIANYGYHGAQQAHKSLGTWPRGTARFSFTYFNEESDIEAVTKALWQLTVHNDKDAHIQRMPKE